MTNPVTTQQNGAIPAQPGPRGDAVIPGAGDTASDPAGAAVIPGAGPSGKPGSRPTVKLREAGPDDPPRYAPEWLELREPADAAARAHDLLDPLRIRLANLPGKSGGVVIHDLGCGTGSMGRWLAPCLDGPQHWILHDRDPYLLHFAAVASPRSAADGSRVTVETRRGDIARLTPDALHGASLVTASALLDVLTREEIGTLAAACAGAGCPALLTLSVAGRVELTPSHPLDAAIGQAFNDHQRRDGLLGPDAVTAAAEAFSENGATVRFLSEPLAARPRPGGAHGTVAARLGRRRRRTTSRSARRGRRLPGRPPGCLRRGRVARHRPPHGPPGSGPPGGPSVMSPQATGTRPRPASAESFLSAGDRRRPGSHRGARCPGSGSRRAVAQNRRRLRGTAVRGRRGGPRPPRRFPVARPGPRRPGPDRLPQGPYAPRDARRSRHPRRAVLAARYRSLPGRAAADRRGDAAARARDRARHHRVQRLAVGARGPGTPDPAAPRARRRRLLPRAVPQRGPARRHPR
ncbi:glycosyl transferase [Streptomyces viridochromogenes DSM 40736]|uniref:Glycosyl transferase n=1 Tax=Streptomyces viridochromogenes (strain DSM 40736 / JCM 4977 / BCRC 1201 / Tue 494) TaxID=591159 RepID=D9X5V4_STRVT|nr:glycosyl transferase [Streptomyces viridochromogenes DSM 40736]